MSSTITLPLWLVFIVTALALFAAVNHFFLPGIRWLLRRRVNSVINEVNARLRLELPTFQLTKRQVLIDRLIYDPEVMKTVAAVAADRGVPRDGVMAEVFVYAREMVPAFNAFVYFKLGYWLARRLLRALYQVRLGFTHEGALAEVPADTAVVFFINHRSNFDYLLVTYLASGSAALSYGAGEWARVWPFRSALRLSGAYILRRDTSNPLYRKVLERYVQMATQACVPHAIFGEGQLSRDGAVNSPKLGMLGYITKTFNPDGAYDILFVPVATNYDRVAEERTLIANVETDFRSRGSLFVLGSAAGFLARLVWRKLRRRGHSYSAASASFGAPLSLRSWSKGIGVDFSALDKNGFFAVVEQLGQELTERVIDVVPVLAVPLISSILIEAQEPLDASAVKRRASARLNEFREMGAHIGLQEGGEDVAINRALEMLRGRGLVIEDRSGRLLPASHEHALLSFYARSIEQVREQISRRQPDIE